MKRVLLLCALVALLALGCWAALGHRQATWRGVDDSVVVAYARRAHRPPRAPYINTDQGDLLLFMFALAGTAAGFAAGYWVRELFPPESDSPRRSERG